MAETLVKSVPATAIGLVLRPGSCPSGWGFGCVERWGGAAGGGVRGILLGPEGTSPVGLFLGAWSCRRDCLLVGVCRRGWVGWSLFENCTVDASIFCDMHLRVCVVF